MAQGLLASQLEKLPGENAWVKNGEHLRHTFITMSGLEFITWF